MSFRVEFDHGPRLDGASAPATCFANPRRVIRADNAAAVPAALQALEDAQAAGYWLSGFVSYELGYALEPKLAAFLEGVVEGPLLCFGVYDAPIAKVAREDELVTLPLLRPAWNSDRYAKAFAEIHQHIEAGDIYQANLTFALTGEFQGSPEALYATLRARQQVPHGAFVAGEGFALLSRSPELFFRVSRDGRLVTRPMKGTRPRGRNAAEDQRMSAALKGSEKDRAENLMIVDLLRNDLSRIAQIGSVKVPRLFDIEHYATVLQMVSEIQGDLRDDVRLRDVFAALFPCGSITGAPKIRAMEIIAALEGRPRGAYCGSIGWIAPDGSMEFNVAIRTLQLAADGALRLDVGGGVVYDSTAHSEYEEALLKARFARDTGSDALSPLRGKDAPPAVPSMTNRALCR